jgi:cardiolipin synthase
MGRTFGDALTARRTLGAAEVATLIWGVILVAGIGAVSLRWPRAIAYPLGFLLLWLAVGWLLQAGKSWWKHDKVARTGAQTVPRRIDAA